MINELKIESTRKNWIKASAQFGFELKTPYQVQLKHGVKEVFAYLPEYGSENGTVICLTGPPDYETDTEIVEWADNHGVHCSFINVESCLIYNEEYFVEVLDDWRIN